eukprot:scaffold8361_cov118-Isochrysis_galbana.AAC.7
MAQARWSGRIGTPAIREQTLAARSGRVARWGACNASHTHPAGARSTSIRSPSRPPSCSP